MYRGKKIGVVIPAYNEEKLILGTLEAVPEFVDRIYAVNDCSKDSTAELINSYAVSNSKICAIHHEVNQGPGAAIIHGYNEALFEGMDVIATMDGDGQMNPEYLYAIIDPIVDDRCDFVVGNRLLSPESRKGMSKWRFFGNSVLSLLTKIASGYWQLMDPQNGYTAISKRALNVIPYQTMYPRYGYLNERLVMLNIYGFRVRNVAHPAKYGNEKSKIRYHTYIPRVSKLLLKLFLRRMKTKYIVFGFHPLVFYYLFGVIFSLVAIAGAVFALVMRFGFGETHLFMYGMLSLVLFSIGMMFVFFAMFFDMQNENADKGWY
ncbi:MAG: glycosyltransferase family 2 protein, partial [Methanocorpusculum sp.]|nr:glycosyltransferase family 2 protein [Methanocorpusculum sp.]